MNITEPFIRRPIMTTLVMTSLLLFGVIAYRMLPVNDLPTVDFPTISVSANLPGASPETIASAVATPLEKQFSTIAGLDSMNSVSSPGSTRITLQFALDRDIDAAAQDVQSMIARTLGQLPRDMPSPPSFQKVNPADSPILFLVLSSATLPLANVDEYAQTYIGQRLSMVSGVAQVQVFGSQKFAVRVQVDPQAIASRGIGIDEVAGAIQRGNSNLPTGDLQGRQQAFQVESNAQLTNAEGYKNLIVAYRNGSPVYLREIGKVIDSVENNRVASWFNEDRAIVLAVYRQPGANTIEVVDSIKKILGKLQVELPASVKLGVRIDRSLSIRESVHEVQFTLGLAVALVILVIFLFLRNLPATLIPSLAVPLSLVGTFAAMHQFGFSLNNLSLMALTLSVGFVVDDAIVMLENIVRHMERGEKPIEAALRGSKEISFTIVSMTLSLAAVFVPVLFMGGIVGRLLREFAVTITVSILISGFVSLTLTPMMCSLFLRPYEHKKHGYLYNAIERFFDRIRNLYRTSLAFTLRHRLGTVMLFFALFIGTILLYRQTAIGFLPSDDTGQITVRTVAAQGTSFEAMKRYHAALGKVISKNPNIDGLLSSVGAGGPNAGGNTGRFFLRLKPRAQRTLNADEIIAQLRPGLASVPGIQAFPQNPPPINLGAGGGGAGGGLYQFTMQSADTADLYRHASEFENRMRDLPGIVDVKSDMQIQNPQLNVEIDRDKAATFGISPQQIEDALYSAYGSRQVTTINAPNNQYRVILELDPRYQRDPSALALLYVRASSGQLVPLDVVTKSVRTVGPLTVNHLGQLPAVTVSFNLQPGSALGDAVDQVDALAERVLPPSITTTFQGQAQAFQSSFQGLFVLVMMAVLVIYLILGILYESFIHPLTILSGLVPAAFGALATLILFGKQLDLYAMVGILLLVGIVKKNAILMIDFALEAERQQGKSPEESIFEGALVRFRPIMMTTMAAFMGTLPIALSIGSGESRRSLGLAVVGGLVVSQLVTLYITPVIYIYLDRFNRWVSARIGRQRTDEESAAGVVGVPAPAHAAMAGPPDRN